MDFPCGSAGKESACNAGDLGSIPGLGRSPREGNGYPLQFSCLENSSDCYGPWGCKESDTTQRLSLSLWMTLKSQERKALPVPQQSASTSIWSRGSAQASESSVMGPGTWRCCHNPDRVLSFRGHAEVQCPLHLQWERA